MSPLGQKILKHWREHRPKYTALLVAKGQLHQRAEEAAIQHADIDGNDATRQDASWAPQIVTPTHPEYPSAHGCGTRPRRPPCSGRVRIPSSQGELTLEPFFARGIR